MRYLICVSLLVLLSSCSNKQYKAKKEIEITRNYSAHSFAPRFNKELYRCSVEGKIALKKFNLSGILYLKSFDNGDVRVVFQSELGNTFLDFGWDARDSFTVYSIMDKMNKKALIKTLRKDFEMLLAKGLELQPQGIYQFNNNTNLFYHRFVIDNGFVYYITNKEQELTSIENANEHERVVSIGFKPALPLGQLSPQVTIKHHKAGFSIFLKKMNEINDVTEQ